MPRFLIEISHSKEHDGCVKALETIVSYGHHFMTQAEFGCSDEVHAGWLIVEVDSREEAQNMVPPQFRVDARVIQLRKWTREEILDMVKGLSK